MSWISTFIILLAGQSPSPAQDPAKERAALIKSLEAKFEALGPFRAEYVSGMPPHRTYRIVLHLDWKGRRILVDGQPVGKQAKKPKTGRFYSDGFGTFVVETEFLTVRRDLSRVFELLDRALYEVRRLAPEQPKPAGEPEPAFPRVLRPNLVFTINERVEPHGETSIAAGFSRNGGVGWLMEASEAAEAIHDAKNKVWIFAGRGGRRFALDAENGLIRWVEIQVAGKPVRYLELMDLQAPAPLPPLEMTGHAEAPPTVREISSSVGLGTVKEFWQTWSKVRGTPREMDLFATWLRFAAGIMALVEDADMRALARSFIQRESPEEGPWRPDSEELKGASDRFVKSSEMEPERLKEQRKSRLEEWRASLTLALEREEEDGGPNPKEAREFLKKAFDTEVLEAERAKKTRPDPTDVFRTEAGQWTPFVHLMRGVEALRKADYDRANSQIGIAIALWPRFADAYVMRGQARARKADLDGAIEDFTKAIEISPFTRKVHYLRAHAWHAKDNMVRAIEDVNRSLEQDPGDWNALLLRGGCLSRQKFYPGAIKDFTKALELDPGNAQILVWRGYAWWHAKEYTNAEADFTRAIEADSEIAEAFYYRGSLRRDRRRDLAIQDLEKALELAPKVWSHREDAEKLLRELKK